VGDILTTNGMDGVYPPSLTVATVTQVERRTNTTFARIYAQPLAQMGTTYALVLPPAGLPDIDPEALTQLQPKPTPSARDARSKAKAPTKPPTRADNPTTASTVAPHTPPSRGAQP
jgi:rod shape-determining protein MreC